MLISETTRMRGLMSYADEMEQTASLLANALANVLAAVVAVDVAEKQSSSSATRRRTRGGSAPGRSFRRRIRRSVEDVYQQLGDVYFRRAYRMKYTTFKRLANDLRQSIVDISGQKNGGQSRHVPNGRISPDVRLACAIRWFAGGSPYDIMTTFGISHTDTFNSFWYVVEAVNKHPNFVISYPEDHDAQRAIAEGFFNVSRAGFKCCAGAIDGILIWTHKPSKKDCREAGCDEGKFNCSRKKKYGLNCQAVCDVRGRILDISIQYPGCPSDCLAFEGMSLHQKLEDGILAPGLCIFGNNAYLNTAYMATPYPGVSGGTRDSYNFYHSQLRIRIECTFGMLTMRWAILRSAKPVNVTIKKTVALVLALAKLHNYCIEVEDGRSDLTYIANDEWNSELNGSVPLVPATAPDLSDDNSSANNEDVLPTQLLHGGEHFDDIGGAIGRYNRQRRYNRNSSVPLPRDQLHSYVASIGITRPIPLPRR